MSLKERLDKKKKKYMQKLSAKENPRSKRLTAAPDEDDEAPQPASPVPAGTKKDRVEKDRGEKEVWKYEGETNEDGEVLVPPSHFRPTSPFPPSPIFFIVPPSGYCEILFCLSSPLY